MLMKPVRTLLLALSLAGPACAPELRAENLRPVSLAEACSLALARSEALAASGEGLKQLEAAERAARASFRPYLDVYASHVKEQNSDPATRAYLSGGYSLFSGMRDYLAVKAASALKQASELQLGAARRRLSLDAARAYLDLSAAQAEVLIRSEQLAVTERRIAELDSRAAIGRTRKSEVVAARTQLAQDKAAYLAALSLESSAQQALLFLTGLEDRLAPEPLRARPADALETYLKSVLAREDLAAARQSAKYYSFLLDIQDRSFWPSADLTAEYYALRDPMPAPENRWNAGLRVKLPLYNGGENGALRQAAYSARRAAELAAQGAERQALSEIKSLFEEQALAVRQTASLEQALALAAENADLQSADYKLSLVTNLEVLSALNTLQAARLALSQARVRQAWTLLRLESAAGLELK